jgi:hypothetical protein
MIQIREEKDIQRFISNFPWILNINYRNVPELDKNGLEYYINGNKRTDLILKDCITNCPVVVEFKYWDLKREDIGQILEYKARIFTHFNDENELLFKIFDKKLFLPKLVLVVRSSDEYGRIACNLQNIELYEFGSLEKKIIEDIPYVKRLEEFSKSIKKSSLSIDEDRNEYLENNVYKVIEELFEKYKIRNKWHNYRNANIGEWYNYKTMFLNKWILQEEDISIGIYEDLIYDNNMEINVTFYSWKNNPEEIKQVKKKIKILEKYLKNKENLTQDIFLEEPSNDDGVYECFLTQKYENKIFYENVKKIMDFSISSYLKVIKM